MKRELMAALAAGLAMSSVLAADKAELNTPKLKSSYAIGLNIGKSFKQQSVDVDFDAVLKGLKDGAAGTAALSDQEIQETMMALQQEMQAKASKKGESAKKDGETFLAENKAKEGVKSTASGLQYKVIKEGTGAKPKATDVVSTHYRGTLIDGTEFDSSYKRGEPTEFPVNGVIKGWTEALQLMPVGSKWQLFIPSDIAYGERGAGGAIGPNSTLIFELELLAIKSGEDAK